MNNYLLPHSPQTLIYEINYNNRIKSNYKSKTKKYDTWSYHVSEDGMNRIGRIVRQRVTIELQSL